MQDAPNILIVESQFYEDISNELVRGAADVLKDAGVTFERLAVPGVFEIPAAIRFAIRSLEVGSAVSRYSGFMALGCVIRGETTHYDYVCAESSRALMDMATNYSIALGYGILTCENREQAWARASVDQKNKGADVAKACLRMMELKKIFRLVLQ